jgi:mRNA-degrading endonuclease toxin of MazEF toxin-antitoxin module
MLPARGDLYFLDVQQEHRGEREDYGSHMHVVVSRQEINELGRIVIVVPLTSPVGKDGKPKAVGLWRYSRIRIPAESKIWEDNAPHWQEGDSLAKTEQIFCVSQSSLGQKCGKLTETALDSLESGLCFVLNLPSLDSGTKAVLKPGKAIRPPIKSQ